jgi:Tol biopolymer transport system component/predicted Ser/Thr protein kinase
MSPRTQIAHYRITSKLGEGGMGAVYRATDTKLNRDVAVKVLPDVFSADPDRLTRFTREAQVLASLNHPNIAAIYGVEERALVMELVEGPTLSERIEQGALPVEEALEIARQIGDALEAAHEKGVIHRDLKPANIKLTADGRVKVLDFGLAKAMGGERMTADPVNSPTMTMSATVAGVIMGTAGYMAPEQAKGKPVDRRADIWAFGVVLHEMLTGRRLFEGETATEVMAAVLTREPDLEAVPPRLRKLLRSCLERDPKRRLRDIGDVWRLLDESGAQAPVMAQRRSPLWMGMAAALAVIAAIGITGWWRATRPPDLPLMRLNLDLGPDAVTGADAGFAISPDGRRVVFPMRRPDGKTQLATRVIDQEQPTVLSGTENGHAPFFSPDGRSIGFFAESHMQKISMLGGAAVMLASTSSFDTGGSWDENGDIVVALSHTVALSKVPAAGGDPQPLTKLGPGEQTHRWPQVLPGGKAVLYTASPSISGVENANIMAADLKTGQSKLVVRGGYYGRYVPAGYLLYVHDGVLLAAHFDLSRLEVSGTAIPFVEDAAADPLTGDGRFAVTDAPGGAGTLVYLGGKSAAKAWQVNLVDSTQSQPLIAAPGAYYNPMFSPDGKRLALVVETQGIDIFVYEIARGAMTRLTSNGTSDRPVWTPDGSRIAYTKKGGIWWVRSDGAAEPELLAESPNPMVPWSFSPDGRRLAYFEVSPETTYDIGILPIDWSDANHPKPGTPQPFLRTPKAEAGPMFSPDGQWIAYSSNESGRSEVYVRPASGAAGKWQISDGGGMFAFWSPDGHEIFYESPDGRIQIVDYVVKAGALEAGKPRVWSSRPLQNVFKSNLALAPDGRHFAAFEPLETKSAPHIGFLLNIADELKRRLP